MRIFSFLKSLSTPLSSVEKINKPKKFRIYIKSGNIDNQSRRYLTSVQILLLEKYTKIPKSIRDKEQFPFEIVDQENVFARDIGSVSLGHAAPYQIDITYNIDVKRIVMNKYAGADVRVPESKIIDISRVNFSSIDEHVDYLLQEVLKFIYDDTTGEVTKNQLVNVLGVPTDVMKFLGQENTKLLGPGDDFNSQEEQVEEK